MMQTEFQKFEDFKHSQIFNSKGISYREFIKSLTPKYSDVWHDIFLGYIALLLTSYWAVLMDKQFSAVWLPFTILVASLLFGYIHHYLQLFFHEAAHHNLAKDRNLSDLLANIFIGCWVGQDIKAYRPVHLLHHRYLGTTKDTEHSYFDSLNLRFIIESLTGIRVVKVLLDREKTLQALSSPETAQEKSSFGIQFVLGALLNGTIVMGSALLGWWSLSISWAIGFLIVFPFFGSVRQLLEHRSESANSSVDYSKIPHGKTVRMFGNGLIDSTFGAAGFNRHLIHHWDMKISYTLLKEVEEFLLDTQVSDIFNNPKTSYIQAFSQLYRAQ